MFGLLSPFENGNSYENKKKKRKKEKKNGGPKDLYSNLLVDTGLNTSSKKKSSNPDLAIILAKNEVKNI